SGRAFMRCASGSCVSSLLGGATALDISNLQDADYQIIKRMIEYVKSHRQTRIQGLGLRAARPYWQGAIESETAGVAGPALPNGQDGRDSGSRNRDEHREHLPAPSSAGGGATG